MIQSRHMKDALSHIAKQAGPIARLAHGALAVSQETGRRYLPADAIEKALVKAGYAIEYTDKERGAWCRVFLEVDVEDRGAMRTVRELVAQGFASANADGDGDGNPVEGTARPKALLQAVRGAAREEALYAEVDGALAAHGFETDRHLRDQLVARLHRGGRAQLDADLEGMAAVKAAAAG